jgi:hypothetical protein
MRMNIDNSNINNVNVNEIYFKKNGTITNLFNFVKLNYLSIVFLIINLYVISRITDNNFLRAIFTFIFAENWTYWSHKYCHYSQADTISKLHMVHHTPLLRHNLSSDIIESLINFIIIGGIILIPLNILIKRQTGIKLLNNHVLIYWAFIYTTYHLFNFHYFPNISHQSHHKTDTNSNDKRYSINATNYGPEYLDIINETKPDGQPIQNVSTIMINMVIATIIVYRFKRYINI